MHDPQPEFRAELRKRRLLYVTASAAALALLGLYIFEMQPGEMVPSSTLGRAAGVLALLISFVPALVWRCPRCRGPLGGSPNPKQCGRCGTPFRNLRD
ncbi:MAG: hypothetical protein ACK47B_02645 [Armatimonadota bacterium]